jgi:hypothetical protein
MSVVRIAGGANLPVDVVAVERGRRLGPHLVGSSPDSPLEQAGFEPSSVPLEEATDSPAALIEIVSRPARQLRKGRWDYQFESSLLQRRVRFSNEPPPFLSNSRMAR